MIFFGPGRLFLVFLLLFFLFPLFLYAPELALLVGGAVLVLSLVAGVARSRSALERPERAETVLPSRRFAEVRSTAEEDLLALADDIRALDLDVEMPSASAEAKWDYERALEHYERAKRALDRARSPEDLERVSSALEEGHYAIASARARLEGREPPTRRPPCFFDPRHGPSVRDVEWAPPGGVPRPVPACAADAIRIEEGEQPFAREVVVRGQRVPYWDAPPYYGPWVGGYFGGFAGLIPTLLMGSALGGGLAVLHEHADEWGGEGDFGDADV